MKIVFFISDLSTGGAERTIVTLANWFADHNHEVMIQTLKKADSFFDVHWSVKTVALGVEQGKNFFSRIIQRPFRAVRYIEQNIKKVKTYKPDIIVSFLVNPNLVSILSRWFVRSPLAISERNDPVNAYTARWRRFCTWLYPKADVIICQSEPVASYYHALNAKCSVLPNPLNSEAVGGFIDNKKKVIVSVGRLVPQKNHKMLIEAFAMIYPRHKDYSLMIIGEGPLKEELEKTIEIFGLQDVVKIHNNIKNVMTKVNDSACFVLPSDYEGMPNVLIEAMASGMPVVSTDFGTGVARELIKDGANGYLVPVGDVVRMAEAIEKVISSEEVQRRMGMENLKVREQFAEDKICSQWEALFRQMVGSAG